MRPLLYLDTARLGQTLPAARDAQIDFVRLTAEEPSSLYFEEFLRNGYGAWPTWYQNRFPGLRTWTGVRGLKQSLRQLSGAPDDWTVLLASRSLFLVHLAARSMFSMCRNVLSTDLSWSTYQAVVTQQASTSGRRMTTVPLRNAIFHHGWTVDDVASYLAQSFVKNHCDGLFLPAVDNLGIRLPIREIVHRIEQFAELRFVIIDAAQAFCQVPLQECFECADFIVTGAHKWLRAYQPMGIGFFGRRRSRVAINRQRERLCHRGHTCDPLMDFTELHGMEDLDNYLQTVNLTSLFACAGAVPHYNPQNDGVPGTVAPPVDEVLSQIRRPAFDWHPIFPEEAFRSRIVLFKSPVLSGRRAAADVVQRIWMAAGFIVTGYADGRARLSFPH